jgi:hypothetical protein
MTTFDEVKPEESQTIPDHLIKMATKMRHAMDSDNLGPIDRKIVLCLLVANFVMTTNELLNGGDRSQAIEFANNINENVQRLVDQLIDMGGMRIEGLGTNKLQ